MISNLPLFTTNQAQPEPKRPVAAVLKAAFISSKLPNVSSIASLIVPVGCPPALGAIISQKNVWFAWPPPLLRTAVRISSGIAFISEIRSSTDFSPNSGCFSIAAFKLVT